MNKLMKLNVENVSLQGKVIRRHFAAFFLGAERNAHNSEVWAGRQERGSTWRRRGVAVHGKDS